MQELGCVGWLPILFAKGVRFTDVAAFCDAFAKNMIATSVANDVAQLVGEIELDQDEENGYESVDLVELWCTIATTCCIKILLHWT